MVRPTVAIWAHYSQKWWIQDCTGAITWFDDRQIADHVAFNNFLRYTENLEAEILTLKAQIKEGQPCVNVGTN